MKGLRIYISRTFLSLWMTTGLALTLFTNVLNAQNVQLRASIDTDSIKIGEQISYTIEVEVDSGAMVFFPKGQTFLPLEVIDSTAIDTSLTDRLMKLRKTYGLSVYDSGKYTIPLQQVTVDRVPHYTDTFAISVQNVVVDTTLQGLYDIKDISKVNRAGQAFWDFLPYLLLLLLAGFLGFWYFVVRKQSALGRFRRSWDQLTPFERAGRKLEELGESRLILEGKAKAFYTQLTDILRNYLQERMGISATELTTAQLLDLLEIYNHEGKNGLSFRFTEEHIRRIREVLERADLVKFAKWKPGAETSEQDLQEFRSLISEFESLYKEVLAEKAPEEEAINRELGILEKRRKMLVNRVLPITGLLLVLLVVAWQMGWLVPGKLREGQQLIRKDWVESTYGFPPVTLRSPEVLKRYSSRIAEEKDTSIVSKDRFTFSLREGLFSVEIRTVQLSNPRNTPPIMNEVEDLLSTLEMEKQARNLITKQEDFSTSEGVQGVKFFGSGEFKPPSSRDFVKGRYTILAFGAEGFYQIIRLNWRMDDPLSEKVADSIVKSVKVRSAL